jgi:hypothetical protein
MKNTLLCQGQLKSQLRVWLSPSRRGCGKLQFQGEPDTHFEVEAESFNRLVIGQIFRDEFNEAWRNHRTFVTSVNLQQASGFFEIPVVGSGRDRK